MRALWARFFLGARCVGSIAPSSWWDGITLCLFQSWLGCFGLIEESGGVSSAVVLNNRYVLNSPVYWSTSQNTASVRICGVGLLYLLTAGSPALSGRSTVHFKGFLRSLQDNEPLSGNRDLSVYPQTCNASIKICCPTPYPLCFRAQYILEHLGRWSDVLLYGWQHQLSMSSGDLFHLVLC